MSKESENKSVSYEMTRKGNILQRYIMYQKELDKRVRKNGGKN